MRQVARLQKENETLKQQGTRAPEGGRHAKKGQPERVAMTPEATPPATRRPHRVEQWRHRKLHQ